MKARLLAFGEVEVEGEQYDHDLVIAAGKVSKRRKGVFKARCEESGHTPLSAKEDIPWGGDELIVGTGAYGQLPVVPAVHEEAKRRGVKLVALPTGEACEYLAAVKRKETYAVLHVTC